MTVIHVLVTLIGICIIERSLATPLTVLVDPGHGGRDQGTTRETTHESDITLAVSHELRDLLKRDPQFRVEMTRTEDSTVSLLTRTKLAKNKKADLVISIHVNSSPDPKAKGAEFYFQNQLPPDEESMLLAHRENALGESESAQPVSYAYIDQHPYAPDVTAILNDLLDMDRVQHSAQLTKSLRLAWNGSRKSKNTSVRQAPFYVLSQMRTPSALIELGFLTNADDYAQLIDVNVQARMAKDIYRGLVLYKESIDKGLQSP